MIYNFIAYAPKEHDRDLAWAYNHYMSQLPGDGDWACFIDHDAMFTTADWYNQMSEIVEKHPEYSCFVGASNRLYAEWQVPDGIDRDNHDILYHRRIGRDLREMNYGRVIDVTECANLPALPTESPFSGVVILYKKAAWKKVPFRQMEPKRLTGVDNLLHLDLRDKGHKVGLMSGIYVYHWHRAKDIIEETDPEISHGAEWAQLHPEFERKTETVGIDVEAAQYKIKECKDNNFVIIGVTLPYTRNIDLLTCLWVEYQKRKPNMMALYESSRFASHGRNNVIYKTLKYLPGATHVFFVDNDVIPPVDAIEKLMAFDKDVVVGATPIYKERPCWSVMKYDPDEKIDNIFTPVPYEELPEEPFRAHHCGGTTILIKRHVLEAMGFPWYQDIFAPGALLLGQDLFFTAKLKHYGFELWCEPSVKCEHIRQSELKTVFDNLIKEPSNA